MNILALDASTKSTGVAVYKHNKLTQYDCLKSASSDLFKRISAMVQQLDNLLTKDRDIDYIILQQVRQDGFVNIKTYKALMYLQGCIGMLIHHKYPHIQMDFIYPSAWRKVCQIKQGRGIKRDQQKKNDIQWVKNNFNIEVNDDIADAIGIGYAYIKEKS